MEGNVKKQAVLERVFHLEEKGTNVKTELLAGCTTFLSCVSIVVINPLILSGAGMDLQAVFWATAISAAVACIWMGLWCNLPFALGPAMGLNTYLVFYVVQTLGLTWQNGLACVFISGCTFMLLGVMNVQQKIVNAIPSCVKQAIGAGIGLFIALTGFQNAGIVVSNPDTLLTLGDLSNPGTLLAMFGFVVMAILVIKNVRGGILLGILLITVLGIFIKNPATGESYTMLPDSIISVTNPMEALSPTLGQLSIKGMFSGSVNLIIGSVFAIISFLFVDLFDSIGVLLGVAEKAEMVDENGQVPYAGKALFVSAGGAAIGALLGTSTVTIYGAESATGIADGGRSGLTSCTVGLLFVLCTIFSPIFLVIPTIATAPALIIVGIFMIEPLCHIDLSDFAIAMPVFFAAITMPFTYNIAYGILFALLTYTLGQVASGKRDKISKMVWVLTGVFMIYLILDIIF